jgi:Na+/H+ antiporter NhaD/arsenite permease-like protein
MREGFIGLLIGVALIIGAWLIWRRGDPRQGFLLSLVGAVIDIFVSEGDITYFSGRTISLLLFLIGIIVIIYSIVKLVS